MPAPLNSKIRVLETEMQLFANDFSLLYQNMYNLSTYLNLEGNPLSSTYANAMGNSLFLMYGHWVTGSNSIRTSLIWCLDYINNFGFGGGGGGITMADILAEMLSATFEELTQFMGITQAYKVAVWDAPFNEEFYAALARGFKVWGA